MRRARRRRLKHTTEIPMKTAPELSSTNCGTATLPSTLRSVICEIAEWYSLNAKESSPAGEYAWQRSVSPAHVSSEGDRRTRPKSSGSDPHSSSTICIHSLSVVPGERNQSGLRSAQQQHVRRSSARAVNNAFEIRSYAQSPPTLNFLADLRVLPPAWEVGTGAGPSTLSEVAEHTCCSIVQSWKREDRLNAYLLCCDHDLELSQVIWPRCARMAAAELRVCACVDILGSQAHSAPPGGYGQ